MTVGRMGTHDGATRVRVVLPTYNEALNLPDLVPRLLAVGPMVDVLVVDDASPDGTADVVQNLSKGGFGDRLTLLSRSGKAGRGSAVMAGFKHSLADDRYAWFAEMDADQSHQPEELPALLEAGRGADMVVGSRYIRGGRIEGWSLKRKAWSAMSNRIIRIALGVPMTDFTNGYRVYNRRALELLSESPLRETGFISLSEWAHTIHRSGLTIREVPTVFINRRLGTSNMSAAEAIGALRALVRLRGWLPRGRAECRRR
jgi:dolichol-phosphate mannosyltransferase